MQARPAAGDRIIFIAPVVIFLCQLAEHRRIDRASFGPCSNWWRGFGDQSFVRYVRALCRWGGCLPKGKLGSGGECEHIKRESKTRLHGRMLDSGLASRKRKCGEQVLGSARVPRAGFGVSPKRSFVEATAANAFSTSGNIRDCETQSPTRETRALPGSLRDALRGGSAAPSGDVEPNLATGHQF